jgi:hypothetical protein
VVKLYHIVVVYLKIAAITTFTRENYTKNNLKSVQPDGKGRA